ncbi:MAG: hypothetical protein F6J87_24375 [Spirulina sp. SIO3F2]|nr:hypothetical protein [Spirulina sp. SIO3F2]
MFSSEFYEDDAPSNEESDRPKKGLGVIATIFFVLLCIPAALLTLIGFVFIFTDKSVIPFLLFAAALLVVLPPMQMVYINHVPPLRFRYLNMFLAVVLMLVGLTVFGSTATSNKANQPSEPTKPDVPAVTLNAVQLCNTLTENTCDGDYNLFTRDISEIFIVGTPENFAEDTAVTLEITYSDEPQTSTVVKNETFTTPIQDGQFQVKYTPESLPVGSYELALKSEAEGFEPVTKTFEVWPNKDWIDAIAGKTKPEVDTELKAMRLCVDTQPIAAGTETTASFSDRCAKDLDTFTSDVEVLQVDVELEDAKDGVQLTFAWFYQNDDGSWQEVKTKTIDLELGLRGFLYSLRADFVPGNYEVLAMLEASNRPPLRHTFTITKSE